MNDTLVGGLTVYSRNAVSLLPPLVLSVESMHCIDTRQSFLSL